MASASLPSSSSSARRWTHDVFLSYRGADTRRGFTSYLYDRLQEMGIKTFMYSTGLPQGQPIALTILKAIEESRLAIVVLSPNFAASTWCLDELTKICECMIPEKDRRILPVFYDIHPSHVRRQSGSFGEDFGRHERSGLFESDKIQQWRDVLSQVAIMSGWVSMEDRSDLEIVKDIAEYVYREVRSIVINKGDFPAIEATKRAAVEVESESNENVGVGRPDTIELEPTRPDYIAVEATAPRWTYDVFLSFMGADTRRGFTSYLYDRLAGKGVKTFMDNSELTRREAITPSLLMTIEKSRFAIVVLSANYASSARCLDELTKIWECMILSDCGILPVFYEIHPSNVRRQSGSFRRAFDGHERSGRFEPETIQRWRDALRNVADLSGWMTEDHGSELELGKVIVESVYRRLQPIEINKRILISKNNNNKRILPVFYYVLIICVALIAIWKKSSMPEFIEDFEATTQAANGNSGQWKHDVFLSFRGEDTRKGFLSHLYRELQNTKIIRTFKDDEQLKKGKDISQTLLMAIEESRFAIIVLSENYAFSAWCLDELSKIFQCMEGKDTILPIFYHVDPSDVRYQRNRYEVAFTNHSNNARHATEKVKQWRADLTKVGSISGWHSKNYKSESELIVDIAKFLLEEVLQVPRGDF